MIAAIEACTDSKIEAVVGKPSQFMADAILSIVGFSAENCLMIGDRWETDVKMGLDAGMHAALTLTGATTRADLAQATVTPTYVIESLAGLLPGQLVQDNQ
jgi:ribonucleotide monophosphatase NagD (HAD superfamily)